MTRFTESLSIAAPRDRVWAVLSDIGSIAKWNPGLRNSHATNETIGMGATRHCVISAKITLDEEVVAYDPPQMITFRITRSDMPFKRADIRFDLEETDEGTRVRVTPDYQIKFGVLGSLLDLVMIKSAYRKGMRGLLRGLKAEAQHLQN